MKRMKQKFFDRKIEKRDESRRAYNYSTQGKPSGTMREKLFCSNKHTTNYIFILL